MNAVVGAAILGLPGKIFALIGGASLWGWLPCVLAMGAIAACFAEVGSRFRATGGPYIYALESFGPRVGFLVGWLSWVSRLFTLATIGNLMVVYAAAFAPQVATGWGRAAMISALFAALAACALAGAHRSTQINSLLSVAKIALLGLFVLGGGALVLVLRPAHAMVPLVRTTGADWRSAFLLMTYAFLGVESAVINTGEIRQPARDIPLALGLGFLVITAIYVGVQAVCMASVPDLAIASRPVTEAVERMIGPGGGAVAGGAGLIIMFGTLFAVVLTGSRLPYGLAERGQFPGLFARLRPVTRTPWAAILLTTGVAWALTLGSSFLGALSLTTLTRLIGYLTTCVALLVFRSRGGAAIPAGFHVPLGVLVSLVASLTVVVMMAGASFAECLQVVASGVFGLIVLALVERSRAGGDLFRSRRGSPGI